MSPSGGPERALCSGLKPSALSCPQRGRPPQPTHPTHGNLYRKPLGPRSCFVPTVGFLGVTQDRRAKSGSGDRFLRTRLRRASVVASGGCHRDPGLRGPRPLQNTFPDPCFCEQTGCAHTGRWHIGATSLPALGTVFLGKRGGGYWWSHGAFLVFVPKLAESPLSPCPVNRSVGDRGRVSLGSPAEHRLCPVVGRRVGGGGIESLSLSGGLACPEPQGGAGIQMGRPQALSLS